MGAKVGIRVGLMEGADDGFADGTPPVLGSSEETVVGLSDLSSLSLSLVGLLVGTCEGASEGASVFVLLKTFCRLRRRAGCTHSRA